MQIKLKKLVYFFTRRKIAVRINVTGLITEISVFAVLNGNYQLKHFGALVAYKILVIVKTKIWIIQNDMMKSAVSKKLFRENQEKKIIGIP